MQFRLSSLKYFALCAALVGTFACDSNNGGGGNNGNLNPGTGTGNPAVDTQTTEGQVSATTQTGIQQTVGSSAAQVKFGSVSDTVQCAGGGTAQVTGDVNSGNPTTFDLDFDFTGCTVLDGTVTVVGEFNLDQTSYSYFYTIDGDVGGNGCVVSYEGFLIDIDIPDLTNVLSYQAIIDGAIFGECLNGNTTCDYDQVTITSGSISGSASCN